MKIVSLAGGVFLTVSLIAGVAFAQFGGGDPGGGTDPGGDPFGGGGGSGFLDLLAETYMGDENCAACHQDKYDSYMRSGHPWKLFRTAGDDPTPLDPAQAERWPHTPVPPLPATLAGWEDVEYVIGNFFWKARYIQRDGFIHTGDAVQWNIADQEFVGYHAGEVKPFDCGRCHTTGYDPEGNQLQLDGLVGTWEQDGVRCEACHGPGGAHMASPLSVTPPGGKACSECHYRDELFRMPWKSGFMRHHQQAEDHFHSPHHEMACSSCHDPHKSVVYNLGGTTKHCSDCHAGNASNGNYLVEGMGEIDCIDCHMPNMAKSAAAVSEFEADVRGHLFRIMTDPISAAENVTDLDGDGNLYWNQDGNGDAAITLDYACMGCHIAGGAAFAMTIAEAAAVAPTVHVPPVRPEMAVDIKANNLDQMQIIGPADLLTLDCSVFPGASDGDPADWFIVASTPWGWYYWDPVFDWQPGFYPSLVDFAVFEVDSYNVYTGTLYPGYYTLWFGVFSDDGTVALDSVSVYVFP